MGGFSFGQRLDRAPRKPAVEPACPMKPLYWTRIQIQDNKYVTSHSLTLKGCCWVLFSVFIQRKLRNKIAEIRECGSIALIKSNKLTDLTNCN